MQWHAVGHNPMLLLTMQSENCHSGLAPRSACTSFTKVDQFSSDGWWIPSLPQKHNAVQTKKVQFFYPAVITWTILERTHLPVSMSV